MQNGRRKTQADYELGPKDNLKVIEEEEGKTKSNQLNGWEQ